MQHHPTLQLIPVMFPSSLVGKAERGRRNASREILLSKPIVIADLVARIRAELQTRDPTAPGRFALYRKE